jgi:hypothetical protein
MSQGEGIKGMVKGFRLPPAMRVAYGDAAPADGPEFHPCLLATEHKTRRQEFRVYALDSGDGVTPLAFETISEVFTKE